MSNIAKVWETAEGRSFSGTARDTYEYQRTFAVKVTTPNTSLAEIGAAIGVKLGDVYPDDPSVYASSFSTASTGDLLLYKVTVTYTAPDIQDADPDGPEPPQPGDPPSYDYLALPPDQWSGSSSVAAVPCTVDIFNEPITNTAGQGIPNLQKDKAFCQIQLVRAYMSLSVLINDINTYTNTINEDYWPSDAEHSKPTYWKCQGCTWSKQTQSSGGTNLTYYTGTWTFAQDERGWLLEPLNVGYMHRPAGINSDLEPITTGSPPTNVTEPVPLDVNGKASFAQGAAFPLSVYVYERLNFTSKFGRPFAP